MDDDWDDETPVVVKKSFLSEGQSKSNSSSYEGASNSFSERSKNDGSLGHGQGRGGGGLPNNDNNSFEDCNGNNDGSWKEENNYENGDSVFSSNSGGRGRGGIRSRGRGRGGSRGGRDDERERNNKNESFGSDKKRKDSKPEKLKEIYIPIERITDYDLFTTTITSGVNFMKLDDIDVKVTGGNVPEPIKSFGTSGLRPHLLENVKKSGYAKPTPIQKYAIPIVLAGRDLMSCAQTGSGKTAAFLLPMIHNILQSQEPLIRDGNTSQPRVVIVSPTRELAVQIYEQAKKFAYKSIVKTAVAYGGTSVNHQKNLVIAGCHILVATPGRLNDFVNHGHVSFASLQFFVLDEADRMLDMGFLPMVEQMLGHESMPATGERQTLMFSATFPEEIQHLAGKFLHNYVFVAVGIVGSASNDVEQIFYEVTKFEKRNKLIKMLKNCNERTMVFVETKRNADFLATLLCENEISSTSIHGDRLQSQREQALWEFKKGIRNILVATGVAARGLDIEGIQHVINYDLPKSVDEYVHRIGRTGRVGNRGKATSFYDASQDRSISGQLANILKHAGQEVPDFLTSSGSFDGGDADNFGGSDIRGNDFGQGQNFNQQPAEAVDEDW